MAKKKPILIIIKMANLLIESLKFYLYKKFEKMQSNKYLSLF